MDPETKKILDEEIMLSKENNVMLKKLVRSQKMMTIYRIVYWSIIILSTVGVYYFIQPFLSSITSIYTGGESAMTSLSDIKNNLSNKAQIKDLIDTLNSNY